MTKTGPSADGWWARIVLEYDGARFAGSQFQPGQRTVQGVVEEALARLTGEWRRITLAGRTDTGVHARGQVASLLAPARFTPDTLRRALNALLPEDVAVVTVDEVEAAFHARFSATSRRYVYLIWNGPVRSPLRRASAWHVTARLDVAAMQAAALALVGEHDFASFAGAGHGVPDATGQTRATRRWLTHLSVEVVETGAAGRLIRITVEATAFLPHMVRNIVGALAAVGRGEWPVAAMREVLAAADRRRAAPTAPAHGLTLEAVAYEEDSDYHRMGAERPARHECDEHERAGGQRSSIAAGGTASAEE
jgi:tRNA pseudouridine38-40 synthase